MASKWVTFRDSVIDSLKFDKVTDSMKDELVKWLLDVLLPMAKTAADDLWHRLSHRLLRKVAGVRFVMPLSSHLSSRAACG